MLGRKSEANMLYSIFVFMLKALCHIFATSYIKLAIFLRREDLIKFWVDFQEIIKLSDQLGIYPPEKSIGKLGKDFIAGIVLCILFIADMWEGYLLNPNRGDGAAESVTSVFVIVFPSTLGYLQAIFPFMMTHFLSFYLEILNRLKHTVIPASVVLKVQIYTQLRRHVASCMHLFGSYIVIDMAHSIGRIIMCSYFLAVYTKRRSPDVRGAVSDAATVLAYSYLIWMICKKGSQLGNGSEEVIEKLEGEENLQILDGKNSILTGRRFKQIFLKTDYFKVDLGLIAPATFIECHRFCRGTITQSGEQMHLAEFRDATEQYYFNAFTLLHSCTDIRRAEFWVGGIALDYLLSNSPKYIPSSAWIWIHSGQKFNDTLGWNADGEPSRHPDHLNLQYESCVTMKPIFPSFFVHALNDFFCSDALPCLCEAPLA
ncbi:hypothetical protein Fcan01_17721 [Folsomia candida]|uniref:C-type lectin domain-containing protein n=1 Tax=Folsomia candida TaxID=158441 RepID=A0A226DPA7_FOLCA|nr:hypothetical protein Fcan01_17721 [Folsomia candida]